jgi:protein-arginine kinase activator protein McsA
MNKKHIGSTLDSFLEEKGILKEVEAAAKEKSKILQTVNETFESLKKAGIFQCDYCWETNESVVLSIDPYLAEVHGNYTEYYMCSDCYNDSLDDI